MHTSCNHINFDSDGGFQLAVYENVYTPFITSSQV